MDPMSLMFGEPEPDEPKGKGKGKGKKGGGGGGGMDMMMQMMTMMMGGGDMMGGKGGKGKAAMRVAAGERVYSGKVRKYSEEFGNGMIFCEELFWETGEEVYVHKSTLDEAQAVVGDDIAFFVHYNAKGQAQASRPCMRIGIGQEGALALKGWYKSKEGAAFGFIDCPETMAYFGRDVYVNKDLVEGLSQGTCVAFNINLNGDGMPNASLICHCEETYQPPAGELTTGELESPKGGKGKQGKVGMLMMMMGKGKDDKGGKGKADESGMMSLMMKGMMKAQMGGKGKKGKDKDGGKNAWGFPARPPPNKAKRPEETGEYMTGTVKSFNWDNNYGFIACDEAKAKYGGDVFVIGNELGDFDVGAQIMFQVGINAQGKPQAIDVTSLTGEPAGKRARTDE